MLAIHKKAFKEEERRYHIASFALQTFSTDIANWKPVLSAIQWMKANADTRRKQSHETLDALITDLLRVYALDCMLNSMAFLCSHQGD